MIYQTDKLTDILTDWLIDRVPNLMTDYTADRKEEESMETRLVNNPSAVVWGPFVYIHTVVQRSADKEMNWQHSFYSFNISFSSLPSTRLTSLGLICYQGDNQDPFCYGNLSRFMSLSCSYIST